MSAMNKSEELARLARKRRTWVESSRDNGFEQGIHRLLAHLNPDEAHFVYELLQNAEDAGASRITFELHDNALRVVHNGSRLFSFRDVEAITSIAKSAKLGDVNAIGEFGVGFKAVLSFTDTPCVYSGGYNFEIHDMVCPIEIGPIEMDPLDTVFVFPLMNGRQDPVGAYGEIARGLRRLNHTALLFLSHIESINWVVSRSGNGSIIRETVAGDDSLIRIVHRTAIDGEAESEDVHFYYRLQDQVSIGDRSASHGLAIRVSPRERDSGTEHSGRAVPDPGRLSFEEIEGQLCVFFPASKEHTGLKFHLNGHFAASVDRASIPHENGGNRTILRATGHLLVRGMERLRDKGLLTYEFLRLLPNDEDSLQPFYAELREIVYSSLREKNLIPVRTGKHMRADAVLRSEDGVGSHLSSKDVAFLTDADERDWARGAGDRRVNRILISIGVPAWGYRELLEAIARCFAVYSSSTEQKREEVKEATSWISSKSVAALREFYLLLYRASVKRGVDVPWHLYCILKTRSGAVSRGEGVYFPGDEDVNRLGLEVVQPTLLNRATKSDKKSLKEFLSLLGVREVGEREKVFRILEKYYSDGHPAIGDNRHIAHIRKFVKWFSAEKDVDSLVGHAFLRPERGDYYCKPDECYLDSPFSSTGLRAIYGGTEETGASRTALWEGYAGTLTKTPDFLEFLSAVSVQTKLEIKEVSIDGNPDVEYLTAVIGVRSTYCVEKDYTIADLGDLLERRDPAVAKLIWETLSCASPSVLHARYMPNASAEERRAPSQLVHLLKAISWVPASDGSYRKASEMTTRDLLPDFEWDDRNGWLEAIGFGENEKLASEEHKTLAGYAEALGWNPKDMELLDVLREHPDELESVRKICERLLQPTTFPQRSSGDPDRRSRKVEEQWEDSSDKVYQRRERSVRNSGPTAEIRASLRDEYTDEHGEMYCQICKSVMPFKGRDGKYFFFRCESVEFSCINWQQYLALCPECDARFREFIHRVDASREELHKTLLAYDIDAASDEGNSRSVKLGLGSKQTSIRFTKRHLADLITILNKERDSGPS